ncbi:MAG TPA: SIR2 family protein, partial [Candidatus Nanopelagicales bacterium]|nr:SIR2 family protein [Candidatus Nanopelagicales bacterium]
MDDLQPSLPPELIRAGAAGRLVVMVGSRARRGSGLPSSQEILKGALRRAQQEAPIEASSRALLQEAGPWFESEDDEIEKASLLRELMGEAWLRGAITEALKAADGRPTPLHRALAEVTGAIFVTTDADTLLDTALHARRGAATRVLTAGDVDRFDSLGPGGVLKLHGDLERPSTLVLSWRDYLERGDMDRSAWTRNMGALLRPPRRILIVGFGPRQDALRHIVDLLRDLLGGQRVEAFWLVDYAERVQARATASATGLRPIGFLAPDDAAPWLHRLADAIVLERVRGPAVMTETPCAEENTEDPAWRALCHLNEAASLVNLDQTLEARELLVRLAGPEGRALPPIARIRLAEGLAQLGDIARARAVLPTMSELSLPEHRAALAAARQLLLVLEGGELTEEARSPLVDLHAARQRLRAGQLGDAARRAQHILDRA